MREMAERVAWAQVNAVWPGRALVESDFKVARAAIEAMRVPTPSMGQAGYAAWDKFGEAAVMGPVELIAVWQAMIDDALKHYALDKEEE